MRAADIGTLDTQLLHRRSSGVLNCRADVGITRDVVRDIRSEDGRKGHSRESRGLQCVGGGDSPRAAAPKVRQASIRVDAAIRSEPATEGFYSRSEKVTF